MSSALARAREAYDARDLEVALQLYLGALAEVPAAPLLAGALAGAGNCYELLGRRGRAVALWRQALAQLRDFPAHPLAHQLRGWLDAYDLHPLVFLSYAHADAAVVRPLAHGLRRLRCRIRVDYGAFVPGRPVEEEIVRVMDECPHYVIAWSRAYRERPFTRYELAIIRQLTAAGREDRRSALLVGLDDTPYPEALGHLLMMRAEGCTPRELAQRVRRALGGLPPQEAPARREVRRAARRLAAWSLRTAGTVLASLATLF